MSWRTTSVILALTIALPKTAAANNVTPPPVPANLEVPAGFTAYLMAHATGTQNYICLPSATGVTWTFFGPQATLFDGETEQLMTHFLSANPFEHGNPRPTWQHSRDTSTVWGAAIQSSIDPAYVAPRAIPWLLLQVVGAEYGPDGGGTLTRTTYIQRVNTLGGVAPATGCNGKPDIGKRALVPYTTDYVFYRD